MERLVYFILSLALTLIGLAALVVAVFELRADQAFVAAIAFIVAYFLKNENSHDNI